MHLLDPIENHEPRAGKQYRTNQDRYFHVMGEGWYVNTRDCVVGPFLDKAEAAEQLDGLMKPVAVQPEDPSDSWRHAV
ncbi:MAG: hypothetical protein JSW10_11620 [Pseudomonadota bacterium]|nr:MAG: hypothetical protein JSW10_11620 [Pseudomonadota bacterium]